MAEAWEQWHGEIVNGEFRLRQFLGGSDHSAVFLADRGREAQRVALKFIPANPATGTDDLARWELARRLAHPHLLPIVATGRWQLGSSPFLYIVSELADENLAQVIPQRALTPRETRDMLRPVLDALAYLHRQGLAHGHIAPSNLMAVGDRIKLSSDSLSAASDARNGDRTHAPISDLNVSSRAGVSKAADIWSLGATVVEVLTQRRTAWEETAHGEPLFREKLPEPFREIAKRCLHRDATKRPSVDEIAGLLDQSPTDVKKSGTHQFEAGGIESDGRWRSLLLAGAGALILAAIFGWLWFGPRRTGVSQTTTHSGNAQPATSRPDIRQPETGLAQTAQPEPTQQATRTSESTTGDTRKRERPSPAPTAQGPLLAPVVSSPTEAPAGNPERTPVSAATSAAGRGSVVHEVLPSVPQSARNTITGRVRVGVKVGVDAAGNVTSVNLDSPGPSKYFARIASEAARDWKFTPPQVDGKEAPSEWLLRFGFGRENTTVTPTQLTP